MNTSYMLISVSVSFRHDAILPGNGYNTVSFINLIKSVKLCFKVNLRLLATRLVGACLTFLNICLLFYFRWTAVHQCTWALKQQWGYMLAPLSTFSFTGTWCLWLFNDNDLDRITENQCVLSISNWSYDNLVSWVNLSLIHIWRCRRIERCRSRWSPYH